MGHQYSTQFERLAKNKPKRKKEKKKSRASKFFSSIHIPCSQFFQNRKILPRTLITLLCCCDPATQVVMVSSCLFPSQNNSMIFLPLSFSFQDEEAFERAFFAEHVIVHLVPFSFTASFTLTFFTALTTKVMKLLLRQD